MKSPKSLSKKDKHYPNFRESSESSSDSLNSDVHNKTGEMSTVLQDQNDEIKMMLKRCNDFREKLASIEATSNMTKVLMSDLLDLAQMEKNTFKINEIYFNLHEVIRRAIEIVNQQARDKTITVNFVQNEDHYSMFTSVFGDDNRYL